MMMKSSRFWVWLQRCSFSRYRCNHAYSSSSFHSEAPPPPIRVGFTEDAGRGVFATREIRTGDLIHTADPFLTHPSLEALGKVCYSCLGRLKEVKYHLPTFSSSSRLGNSRTSADALRDSQNDVLFCSSECAKKAKGFYEIEGTMDWLLYHDHCRVKGLKYPLLVKRFACMVISGMVSADNLDILQPANFSHGMPSTWEDEFELLLQNFKTTDIDPCQLTFLTKEWYAGILARIRANVFRIELIGGYHTDLLAAASASISVETTVGSAVYMLPSMYNHDCDPNAHILWIENAKARLKALRDIEPGEELRICYIDASMDYEARQSLLYQGFGFRCQCLRCKYKD